MKNLTILIFALLFIQLTAISQPCLPEGITFTTQTEIDNFQINYPNCTEIEGEVEINGDYITNLNGLNVVSAIGGGLKIKNNDALTNLSGLYNLTSINDDLKILGNDALTSLTGLESLSHIGGILEIGIFNWGGNPVLSSLTGLDNLTTIGGYLRISVNDALTSLTGLENVVSIGGYLEVRENNALTSLSGLDNLTSIGGYLKIWDNNNLTSLTGLENVVSIGGYLKIYGNANLLSLFGLGNIEAGSITDLYIHNNPGLSSCHAQSICDFLSSPNGTINIFDNAEGCNNTYQVADACGLVFSSCLPEGITFTAQAQIDNFQINYPNCTEIEGDVNIGGLYGGTDITNLNELSVITSIGGKLEVVWNNNLTNLSGFSNLTFIGGDLVFKKNEIMTSLVGLENLASVEGSLIIGGPFSGSTGLTWGTFLTSFTGLDNITTIGGNLGIIENHALTNFMGLENVTSIGGELYIDWNSSLNSLTGLDNVTSIGGGFSVSDNNVLTSLTGLDNVTSIGGSLFICNNNVLTSLTGLESLISIEGGLYIGFYIYGGGGGNPSLASLAELVQLISVGGTLEIYDNDVLTSLTGLDNIYAGSINNLYIYDNGSLSTCEVQSVCDYLAIPNGTISIAQNAPGCNSPEEVEEACETLTCLPEGITFATQEDIDSFPVNYPTCIWIEGDVTINGDDIADLNGLDVVTAIGGNLSIMNNDILTSLAGIENITSIGGNLEIAGNTVLSELTGLENIEAGSIADLSIYYNFELSECDIWNICYYINNTSGTIDIHDNATGCNSQEEVIEACLTSVCETITENKFIISPNPLESTTLIQYTLHQSSQVTLKILDLSGREMITIVNEFQMYGEHKVIFKGKGLKPGIYFCVLKTNDGIQTTKIIKLRT